MDSTKDLDILRRKIVEKGKQKEPSPDRKAPESIKIGDIGNGATVIIGGDHSVHFSPINISVTVLMAPAQHGGGFPVPMAMCNGRSSSTIQAMLDALAPVGSPAILLPDWPASACACPFRCAAPDKGGTDAAPRIFPPVACSQFPARQAA